MTNEREDRKSGIIRAKASSHAWAEQSVTVRNLSRHGLSAKLETPAAVGQEIILHLPGVGDVAGVVKWARSKRVGIRLLSAIEPELVFLAGTTTADKRPVYADWMLENSNDFKRPGVRTRK
jgi:PilZ domain